MVYVPLENKHIFHKSAELHTDIVCHMNHISYSISRRQGECSSCMTMDLKAPGRVLCRPFRQDMWMKYYD